MSPAPDILKYFYEEPAPLEPVTPDADPDARRRSERSAPPDGPSIPLDELFDMREAHRGYLAGTNRPDDRVGVTTLRAPDAFATPLREALGRPWWGRYTTAETSDALSEEAATRILTDPGDTAVLVTADEPVPPERMAAVEGRARRRALPALWSLLDTAHVVFFPEPAHDGHDWSLFSTTPMRDRLVAAFRAHVTDQVRRFVLPYQDARSESKFYFDQWQLTEESPLPNYVEEV